MRFAGDAAASSPPAGYPYTAHNQTGDLDAVITRLGLDEVRCPELLGLEIH